MTADEKIDRLREILEEYIDRHNADMLRIEESLKNIEKAIGLQSPTALP
jgi:hypothetical protein